MTDFGSYFKIVELKFNIGLLLLNCKNLGRPLKFAVCNILLILVYLYTSSKLFFDFVCYHLHTDTTVDLFAEQAQFTIAGGVKGLKKVLLMILG